MVLSKQSVHAKHIFMTDIDDDELFRTVDGPGISGKLAILGQLVIECSFLV